MGVTSAPFAYEMYGLHIVSDVRLPTPQTHATSAPLTDVRFSIVARLAAPAEEPHAHLRCDAECHAGAVYSRVYRGDTETWVVNPGMATCRVTPHTGRVDVCPEATADEQGLGLMLAGVVSTALLQGLGRQVLHASAVTLEGRAIAFLGSQGRGKSTMASWFVKRGGRFLTDDILALRVCSDQVRAFGGLPIIKLWDESVEHTLAVDEPLPSVSARIDKKLVRLDDRRMNSVGEARLARIYVLDRYDPAGIGQTDIEIRPLTGRRALAALLAHAAHNEFLLPHEGAELMRACAQMARLVPVRIVRYPHGFDFIAAAHERIAEDSAAA